MTYFSVSLTVPVDLSVKVLASPETEDGLEGFRPLVTTSAGLELGLDGFN